MRNGVFLLFTLLIPAWAVAQQPNEWTLARAVTYAQENNLQVRRLDNTTELARLNLQQSRNNRLPTLSGGTGVNLQLGRTIDPTTNSFEAQNIFSQGYQLQGGVTLYNGGLIRNTLRQAELDLQAAETDANITGNDVALLVANSYLTILLTREQLSNARAQLELTTQQLENTDAMIRAGSAPAAERYDIVAQQAANQRTVVDLENQVRLAKLDLQLLLELDPQEDFEIVTPVRDLDEAVLLSDYDLQEVLNTARQTQPTIRAAELRRSAAEVGKDIARAGLRPTVQLYANVSTNYSNLGKDFENPDLSGVEIVQGPPVPVVINGEASTLATFSQTGVVFPNLGYIDQLNQNFGQSIGFNISVPIYTQNRNKIGVQRAEVQRLGAVIEVEQAENQLRADVERALGDLRAARETYRAAQISQEAAQNAYDITQRRYSAGAANSLDLITATNRLEQARVEFTRTKYQLIFNREVIQFYLGQGLSLN
ncbi:outer membrane protein [Lewinella aquimaris]|uniref:Outer membrane protein n=1 Tax=Neolewinella aquimaris TaxID=1835722 RepID=A0A840EAL7_9BACT|nr:TolC family protein [Neolewinella aquimaris]MBB4080595.1 outer membrane protein [Neolewinella aquimaris]